MKKIAALFLTLLMIAISACNSDDVVPQDCFEVKVIKSYCTGDAVLQILTPAAQSFGETWTDVDGVTYEHVFRTTFPCHFQSVRLRQTFFARLTSELDDRVDCVRCAMSVAGLPETFSHFAIADDCSNNQD